jgi:pyruvyl transferase EpsO
VTVSTQVLESLQDESLQRLTEALGDARRVALVDFPSHQNAGDSLIWLGETNYLRRLGVSIDFIGDWLRCSPRGLRRRCPEGPILLSGGGNLGDVWPHTQRFREQMIAEFPDRPIVQLPQSLHFSEPASIDRFREVLTRHGRVTLMIRDVQGFQRAESLFGEVSQVVMCPDMALGVGRIQAPREPDVDVVALRREDKEAGHALPVLPGRTITADWGLRGSDSLLWTALQVPGAIERRVGVVEPLVHGLVTASWQAQAQLNVSRASALLARGRTVVTNRLHAVVMATLMGREVVAVDNNYGKLAPIFDSYLHRFPTITFRH